MSETILVTASSFPLNQNDTKGNFVLEYAQNLSKFRKVIVLTHHLSKTLKNEKFNDVEVIRFKFIPFSFLDKYFGHGVLHAFSSNKFLFLFLAPVYFLAQLLNVKKIVQKNNINIIHAHWIIPQGLAAVLYKKIFNPKIKIISTIHGGDIFAFKGKLGTALKNFVLKNLNDLTVVSQKIKKELSKYDFNGEAKVLPMGIDTNRFSAKAKNENIRIENNLESSFLLFVGRLAEKKGVKYIIDAMPEILKFDAKIKLLIAGSGPLFNELQKQIIALNLSENVKLLGNVEHKKLPSFYATADVFIGPSIVAKSGDSEGFGLVFAEAAACGTTVLTTDFEAMKDIIINNETGFTVAQKSSKAIAEKVIYILNNKEKVQIINAQAREHIRNNFDWNIIIQQYNQLIINNLKN